MAGGEPLSARNPKIQHLRRLLGRRSARLEAGQFVIEGPTLVREAVAAGLAVLDVFVEDPASAPARSDAAIHLVAPGVLERVGSTVTPRPVLAVATRCDLALDEAITRADRRMVLVLAGVADPGNAGTLLRSAEASGAGAVIFAGDAVDPFNPKVVRSSAGSLFRVPFVASATTEAVAGAVRDAGYALVSTTMRGGTAYHDRDLTAPTAIVLGNESHGVPPGLEVDDTITIPLAGGVESLNVAMAGTLIAFEAARQRRTSSGA